MSYPYPELLPLLQLPCTVDVYQRTLTQHAWKGSGSNFITSIIPPMTAYWELLPSYSYAECPYCHTRYHSLVDSYSLWGWLIRLVLRDALYVPQGRDPQIRCAHFVGVQQFINLHQQLPTERDYFSNQNGDVPYLSSRLFATRVPIAAVLHALPVCRVEATEFVPRYTLFVLTYFSQDPQAVLEPILAGEAARANADPEYFGTILNLPGYSGAAYDLEVWAKRGQLGWLDFTQAELPLRIGKDLQLPAIYQQIAGNRWSYAYRPSGIRRT